jgi:hypothetical protein
LTIPPSIRVNAQFPFPSLVQGSGPVGISKQNGIWTISLSFSGLTPSSGIPNPSTTYSLVWDSSTNIYYLVPISAVNSSKVVKILTAPGPYTALATDEVLIIKQTVGAAFTVNVNWSGRTKPLRVVDGKGDSSTNNISIIPTAGQTQLAIVNYVYVVNGNGGSITLTPLPDGSGCY